MSDIINVRNNIYMVQQATQPCEPLFGSYPDPYLMPQQSRYHNLGLNGYISPYYSPYPGKRPGSVGDYGAVQFGQHSDLRHTNDNNYPYPLDKEIFHDWMQPINKYKSQGNFYRKGTTNENSRYKSIGNI